MYCLKAISLIATPFEFANSPGNKNGPNSAWNNNSHFDGGNRVVIRIRIRIRMGIGPGYN